jgi:hypothetical protein
MQITVIAKTIVLPWNLNKALSYFVERSESENPFYVLANKTQSPKYFVGRSESENPFYVLANKTQSPK